MHNISQDAVLNTPANFKTPKLGPLPRDIVRWLAKRATNPLGRTQQRAQPSAYGILTATKHSVDCSESSTCSLVVDTFGAPCPMHIMHIERCFDHWECFLYLCFKRGLVQQFHPVQTTTLSTSDSKGLAAWQCHPCKKKHFSHRLMF